MKFTKNVDKKPINLNKVTSDNTNRPILSYMGLTKSCVVFMCICLTKLHVFRGTCQQFNSF